MILKECIKFFIPHFRSIKKDPPPKVFTKIDKAQDELAIKAADWWENNCYTNLERYQEFVWLGRTIFRKSYKLSVTGAYFKPANDFVEIVEEMQKKNLIYSLSEKSKVLEPGCNVGRNLYYLQKKYQCEVTGIDISEEAIKKASQDIWKKRRMYSFHVANVLETKFFDQFENNHFDLIFTRWHLIHIPHSELKKIYIEKLKRISKSLVLLEPVIEGRNQVELYYEGRYSLSWDSWIKEYGLLEYQSEKTRSLKDSSGTKVFYYRKHDL